MNRTALDYVIKAFKCADKGNFKDALENIDKALSLDPNNDLALYLKAAILRIMGDVENSIKYFEELKKKKSPLLEILI